MNIQTQKAIIIEQFKQLNDLNLIKAIQSLLDYAIKKEKDDFDISETHKKLVIERFEKVRQNPERLLDWDEAKNMKHY
ncbi:MAG: addiction module protein [Bacteroidales bacterium]|nr:addiction module protein [Bacteroidales bacterium]